MTGKLIVTGLKERLKVYAGIVLLYLLYGMVAIISKPTPRMDNILDWFSWSYEIFGVEIYAMTFVLVGMAAAALLVAEIIIFVRDFYGPEAYLLFSLPVSGKQVVGSRLGLFTLDFLLLVTLDLPFRWPFYRSLYVSAKGGAFEGFAPWFTNSDLLYLGILVALTWILIFTIVPLLSYLLIAVAKCLFDLSVAWLTAFVALGLGMFLSLSYVLTSAIPPLVHGPVGSTTYELNPSIPAILLMANVLIFWSGTRVIDRKLNI
jgi:hypothetical protein